MSAGFSISGLASGIDSNSIVSQLMAVERIPIRTMQAQQGTFKQGIDAWASITTRVSALQDASKGLDKLSDFSSFVTAQSSSAAVTAVASGSAPVGSLSFTVDRLASQHQLFGADAFASGESTVGAGTVSLTVDGTQHDVAANDATTVNDLAKAINDLDIGVNAAVITKSNGDVRLMLTSKDTGADAAFTVASTSAGINSFTEVSTAGDAEMTFGSGANSVTVNRSTNTVGDLIEGVTLSLTQATTSPVTITTSRDTDAAVEAVQTFVTELNSTLTQLSAASAYNVDTGGGPLSGSRAVREIVDGIRRAVSQPIANLNGTFGYASSVGLEIQSNGSFVLNESKLRTALTEDYDAVADLFAASAKATDTRVSFLDAKSSTAAGSYDVQITKAAQVAAATGANFVDPGSDPSFFTITAPDGQSISVATSPRSTAAEVVGKINAALTAANVTTLLASVDNSSGSDRIAMATTGFGSSQSFTVDVDGDPYGLNGTFTGADVEGLINGAAATGTGRLLRSTTGDASGLRLNVTASQSEVDTAGGTLALGTVDYSTGIAGTLSKLLDEYQGSDGTIATAKDSLQSRVDLYQDRIEAFERRLVIREEGLRRQFSAMESAVSQIQSTANFFAAQLGLQNSQQ